MGKTSLNRQAMMQVKSSWHVPILTLVVMVLSMALGSLLTHLGYETFSFEDRALGGKFRALVRFNVTSVSGGDVGAKYIHPLFRKAYDNCLGGGTGASCFDAYAVDCLVAPPVAESIYVAPANGRIVDAYVGLHEWDWCYYPKMSNYVDVGTQHLASIGFGVISILGLCLVTFTCGGCCFHCLDLVQGRTYIQRVYAERRWELLGDSGPLDYQRKRLHFAIGMGVMMMGGVVMLGLIQSVLALNYPWGGELTDYQLVERNVTGDGRLFLRFVSEDNQCSGAGVDVTIVPPETQWPYFERADLELTQTVKGGFCGEPFGSPLLEYLGSGNEINIVYYSVNACIFCAVGAFAVIEYVALLDTFVSPNEWRLGLLG